MSRSAKSLYPAVAALVFIAACGQLEADQTSEQPIVHEISGLVFHETEVAGKDGTRRRNNSIKYRESDHPVASAEVDGTTVYGRALIGANGVTKVEVTSGSLDELVSAATAAESAEITKIQVKSIDPDGGKSVRWTKNFKNDDGYFAEEFSDLRPGWPLEIQVHIKTRPGKTSVLNLNDVVYMRPDLKPELRAQDDATVGVMTDITAFVGELNGDTGARAECKLYAGSTVISEVKEMWVAPSGRVACKFSVSFATPGRYELAASAEDVSPGDYYESNNMTEPVTITVKANEPTGFRWSAYASLYSDLYEYNSWGHYYKYWSAYQNSYVYGRNEASRMTFPVSATWSTSSGPHPWTSGAVSAAQPTYSYTYGGRGGSHVADCYNEWTSASGSYTGFQFCTRDDRARTSNTFSINHYASESVYISSSFGGGYYHTSNWGGGAVEHDGTSMSFSVEVTDSQGVSAAAEGSIPLVGHTYEYRENYDEEEWEGEEGPGYYHIRKYESYYGYGSGGPD